jgi:hypothetical protein
MMGRTRTRSTIRMPTLPPELWRVIAEFIDPIELDRLIGVNRVFFEIVLENRYREVRFIDSDPLRLFRKIDVIKYVRVVFS